MTQYLLALYRDYDLPIPPERTQQVWAGVGELADKLENAGAFVFKGGMNGGPESATVVRQSGEDFLLTDGPYTETKEHLAGFWIIDAADLDVALEWAKLATAACRVPSRSPRSAVPPRDSPRWTTCVLRPWTGTTCSKRHAPTCCAASAATGKPRPPTRPPAFLPRTRSSRPSSTRSTPPSLVPGRPASPDSGAPQRSIRCASECQCLCLRSGLWRIAACLYGIENCSWPNRT
jgi:hypothetical protein